MSVVILTGPAASGKNTVGKAFAQTREKCAVIDVDQVRWMYLKPHKAPWEGAEGAAQQVLGVENACLLAKNFSKNGVEVVILDVITDETAALYKKNLEDVRIVLLMPSFEVAHKRFSERPHTISDEEFKMVYAWQEKLTAFDKKIDNSALSPEDVAHLL